MKRHVLTCANRSVTAAISLNLLSIVYTKTSAPPAAEPRQERLVAVSNAATAKPVALDRVIIKDQAIGTSAQPPFSVKTFDQKDFGDRKARQVQQLCREVAGMPRRGLDYGNVADSIRLRSFSRGGHGSDICFVIDDSPLNEASSHAGGYAYVGILIPLEIAPMSAFKGPVSTLYGNFNRAGPMNAPL